MVDTRKMLFAEDPLMVAQNAAQEAVSAKDLGPGFNRVFSIKTIRSLKKMITGMPLIC